MARDSSLVQPQSSSCAFSILEQTQHVRTPERLPQVTRQSRRDTLPSRTHARSMAPPHERRSATTSSRLFLFGVIFYGRLCDISCDTIHRPLQNMSICVSQETLRSSGIALTLKLNYKIETLLTDFKDPSPNQRPVNSSKTLLACMPCKCRL